MPLDLIQDVTFTAIDFESAGTATGRTDAPVQIGTTTWSVAEGISDTWMSYIFTDQEITWAAQKVHGITSSDLSDAPKLMLLWPKIKERLNNVAVVAHGHGTEKRFLQAFPAHGFGPWIDTLPLARACYPEFDNYSLGNICETLSLTESVTELVPDKTWHDALYDAAASIILLKHIVEHFELSSQPISFLTRLDTSQWRSSKHNK